MLFNYSFCLISSESGYLTIYLQNKEEKIKMILYESDNMHKHRLERNDFSEPLLLGADHQLTPFPGFRSTLGSHLTLATQGLVRPLPNAWVFKITENSASIGLFIESKCKLK